VLSLLLLYSFFEFNWARVIYPLNIHYVKISKTINMHSLMLIKICAPNISKYRNCIKILIFMLGLDSVKSVSNNIRMVYSPINWLYFLNCYESTQVVHFCFWIKTIFLLTRKVKQFCSVMYFFPKSFFHFLFCFSHCFIFSEIVKVSENSHYIWHTMILK